MTLNRFFTRDIMGGTALLRGSERDHCVRVLRNRPGDRVVLVNGVGGMVFGTITSVSKGEVIVSTDGPPEVIERPVLPAIATAIPKNPSRWEYFLEKATEAGVGEIIPLVCARSEKTSVREERSRQIILSAFKQSLRAFLPLLRAPRHFTDLVADRMFSGERFIAWCPAGNAAVRRENPYLGVAHKRGAESITLIGPEGDFTPEEISLAAENGFSGVSLGSERLRVETAGVIACNIIRCIDHLE